MGDARKGNHHVPYIREEDVDEETEFFLIQASPINRYIEARTCTNLTGLLPGYNLINIGFSLNPLPHKLFTPILLCYTRYVMSSEVIIVQAAMIMANDLCL